MGRRMTVRGTDRPAPLPDTGETAVAELRRISDLSTDDVATEPDPCVPGVWKVETPAWVAVVYLAGYGGRAETDFEEVNRG